MGESIYVVCRGGCDCVCGEYYGTLERIKGKVVGIDRFWCAAVDHGIK